MLSFSEKQRTLRFRPKKKLRNKKSNDKMESEKDTHPSFTSRIDFISNRAYEVFTHINGDGNLVETWYPIPKEERYVDPLSSISISSSTTSSEEELST
jgi:hypothetical protein